MEDLCIKITQQRKMREERDGGKVLEDIKDIFLDIMQFEVNNKAPIIEKLVDIVHKFNKDIDAQEKLLQRAERKFENKVLENVEKKIVIDQVELSTLTRDLEGVLNNVVCLFTNLSDTSIFSNEIKEKLTKIDENLKNCTSQLALNLSSSSNHFVKVRFLTYL